MRQENVKNRSEGSKADHTLSRNRAQSQGGQLKRRELVPESLWKQKNKKHQLTGHRSEAKNPKPMPIFCGDRTRW